MRVEGLTNMYVYNGSVVKSSTMTEYILKKRHLSILYHAVRKAVADGKVRIGWVPTGRNISNLLTKVLEGPKIREIVNKILH